MARACRNDSIGRQSTTNGCDIDSNGDDAMAMIVRKLLVNIDAGENTIVYPSCFICDGIIHFRDWPVFQMCTSESNANRCEEVCDGREMLMEEY